MKGLLVICTVLAPVLAVPAASLSITKSSSLSASKSTTRTITPTSTKTSSATASGSRGAVCTGTFKSISAQAWVDNANPGWNLGNTLDATPSEGDWNNPPVVAPTFDDVKAAGFKSVRVPVTYAYHFTSGSPTWDVDPAWLQRVSDVIDMVTSRNLYALTNVHHDSWIWADVSAAGANYSMIEEKFYRLWYQIGTKLACKSSLLAFEPINEPPGTNTTHYTELMKLESIFLKALADSGGFNPQRVVTLNGPKEDSILTSEYFDRSITTNVTNPWAIQYHYYSPYDFIFSAWGKTTWGSDADKAALEEDIANIRGNFSDIPLIIGEWAASPVATETAARWKYFDFFVRTARKYHTSTMLWDNGADFLDRKTHIWRDRVALDIHMSAEKGIINSLPDSTEDTSATTQWTSADIFHKFGTPVTDETLPYLFNGNTLKSIRSPSRTLKAGTDYVVSGQNITYKAALLSKYLSPTTAPGSIANLTLTFSAGAPLTANIVQWDTPTLGVNSSSAAATNGSDLLIPITWKGINKPATVKAVESDQICLLDTFTSYFGPLQECRTTYSGNWNWNSSYVIITAATVADVVAAGKDTTFAIEFYPRVPENTANYTLTV